MKSIFRGFLKLLGKNPLLFAFLFLLSTSSILTLYLWSLYKREVSIHLEGRTKEFRHLWEAISTAHGDIALHYYKVITEDKKVLNYLKMALSEDESKVALARAGLYRHLWRSYEDMKNNFYIKYLTFVTPDNRVLLRFHTPEFYGDDATHTHPNITLVIDGKKPNSSFLIGKMMSGYCYAFPIFDEGKRPLGAVSFCRSTESIKGVLGKMFPNNSYILLVEEDRVKKGVIKSLLWLYSPIDGLRGWLVERGEEDYVLPEHQKVFIELAEDSRLKKIAETGKDITEHVIFNGKHYSLTALKLFEEGEPAHTAVFLILSPAPELASIYSSFQSNLLTLLFFNFLFSTLLYFYLKEANKVRQKQRELETITSVMGGGLILLDTKGRALHINQTACHMLGYSEEELLGKVVHDIIHIHRGDIHECPIYKATVEVRPLDYDDSFMRKDGSFLDVHIKVRPIFIDSRFSGSVILFYDISERKKKEEELYRLATTDLLTGLYNRRFMQDQLMQAKHMEERHSLPFSLLLLDVDNFKKLNDTYGHEMGDKVLKAVAEDIRKNLRKTDIPSRWGGEEFLILLENADLQEAVSVAERIRKEVESTPLEGHIKVTVSIGVASYSKDEDINSLIKRADEALYRAKASGKNRVST